MKNKNRKVLLILSMFIILFLIIYPLIEIDLNGKIIKFSYSGDISEFEENPCYDENYFYNEKRNISVHNFGFNKILFFHIITLEYEQGNVCDTEYLLKEDYIQNIIDNAVITYNDNNIDLAKLIDGKTAIVSNTRYHGEHHNNVIEYILDGKEEILFIFYVDDLLVIQVGLSDEGPKFIAYKD